MLHRRMSLPSLLLALSFDKFGLFVPVAFLAAVLAGPLGVELLATSSSLSTVRSTRGESSCCGSVVGSSGVMQDGHKDWSGVSQVVPRKDSLPAVVGITFVPHPDNSFFPSQLTFFPKQWHCTQLHHAQSNVINFMHT